MCHDRTVSMLLGLLLLCACGTSTQERSDGSMPQGDAQTQLADAAEDAMTSLADAATDSAVEGAEDAGPLPDASGPDANTPDTNAPDADVKPVDDGIPTGDNVFPLVAPSLCTTRNGRMFECNYGPGQAVAPSIPEVGQFKTRVTGHRKGDCATTYPFIARVAAEGVEPFNYGLFLNDHVWLRRDDSAAIAAVSVENGSGFAGKENYAASCRVWLEVEFNVPILPPPPAM